MSITPWIPTLAVINNGQDVSAEVVNPILAQHTQREQHLYEKFANLADKSVLIAYDQPLLPSTAEDIKVNSLVYYKRNEGSGEEGLTLAQVAFTVDTWSAAFKTAPSAYCFGLVKEINTDNKTANIYLIGLVELLHDIDDPEKGLLQEEQISSTGTFEPGPLFLSRNAAGKVTRYPGGVAIFIGYALNSRKLLLAPNVSEFNQFFTAYKFNVVDRPIGLPYKKEDDTWSVKNPNPKLVGWVDVEQLPAIGMSAYYDLRPEGAQFFYNLPSIAAISLDTGLTEDQQKEQKELANLLPPNPPNLTFLTVNGIVQSDIQSDPVAGIYEVNQFGIWWFGNADGQQPWSEDITPSLPFTVDLTGESNQLVIPDHDFKVGQIIRLGKINETDVFPAIAVEDPVGDPLDEVTDYYVVAVNSDDYTKITISRTNPADTNGGSPLVFTDDGTLDTDGGFFISQPYIWQFSKGTDRSRPKAYLQFLKFNPTLKESVVTTLRKYNSASDIIEFYAPDKLQQNSVGDLYARILLDFSTQTSVASSANAIKQLSYDETTGKITVTNTPVVSMLEAGAGITLTSKGDGRFIVASSSNSTSGIVSNIEPDGAELIYSGLHSYINMTVPSVLPSKILGKILLPYSIPNSDLTFVVLLMANETLTVTKNVDFEFRYSISKPGVVLGSTVGPINLSFALPATYVGKTVLKIGTAINAIPLPAFKVPAASILGGDCAVNFELFRKLSSTSPLTSTISIIDIYWRIG